MSIAKTLSKYPKLGGCMKKPKNTSAKCACGELGKFKVDIQWDWMRGNDDVVWSCKLHRKDLNFHTGGAKWVKVTPTTGGFGMKLNLLDKLTWAAFLSTFLLGVAIQHDAALVVGSLGLVLMGLFVRVRNELAKLNRSKGE